MKIQSLRNSVAEHLRNLIITGELKPGAKLNEIDISNRLGISRPPLREAFRKLENEHLILEKPRKGVFVTGMSITGCGCIYESRRMLECEAIQILQDKNIKVIPGMEKTLELSDNYVLPKIYNSEDINNYFNVMSGFHIRIIEAAENDWIRHFYESLNPSLTRYQVLYLNIVGTKEVSIANHRSIYEKITMGCYEEAKNEMKDHINMTRFIVEKELRRALPDNDCVA